MWILKLHRSSPRCGSFRRCISSLNNETISKLCKYFGINQNQAELIRLKQPYVNKLDETAIESLIKTVKDLGFAKDVLVTDPGIFGIRPITLRFRYKVLKECGFKNITTEHLSSYLPLMKRKTIAYLKIFGDIPSMLDVDKHLASFLNQWPASVTSLTFRNTDETTLHSLRMKILQRYLELVIDLTEDEFLLGLKTYPTIKHRPLQVINETLDILQSVVMIPNQKIKTNLYLIHADPENLKQIIYKFHSIGGITMKEIIRTHPRLALRNYDVMVEIKNIFLEYGISDEAQRRCFDIYSLAPDTIRERLQEAKSIPEFQAFKNHTRFLKMIYYRNTALNRLKNLYRIEKQCFSLNVLSGSSAHYEVFQNSPGDRLGKGRELVFCITESLGNIYSSNQIRKIVKRHPFLYSVPIIQVKSVYKELSKKFEDQDIYENCPILLYPWEKINKMLNILEGTSSPESLYISNIIDVTKLNKSQILSLVIYFLEKNHYFTGNGVWSDKKIKNVTQYEPVKIKS